MLKGPILLKALPLKTKITGLVLLLFLCSIWILTYFVSKQLEYEMITQIEVQQFSIASYIADSIDVQVKLRINALTTIADRITPDILANPRKLRKFLHDKPLLETLFEKGCVVISLQGIGIADYPPLPGRTGASFSELEYFKEVIATRRPVVGETGIGRFSNKPIIRFAVPVLTSSGKVLAVLAGYTLASDPTLLGSIKSPVYEDFPDRLLLVSPKYRIFISGSDPTRIMTPTPAIGVNPLFDSFMAGFEGSGVTVNARGVRILLSAKQIPTPGWFIRVGLPVEMAFSSVRSMKNRAYLIAVSLSLLSSLLIWLIVRQSLRPLYTASRLIKDITEERLPPQDIPITRYDEVGQLLTSFNVHLNYRKQAEELIKHSLREKETLLREIHHRVKNNMAVVSSILSLQADKIEDATLRSIFEESEQRIRSIALVHEKLYQTKDLSSINFEEYIRSIVLDIISVYGIDTSAITTEINIDGIELDLELAVPCGLIINELLTNAFKYAFPDNRSGILRITFAKTEDTYILSIKDNGIGLPEGFDYRKQNTLGLQIVDVLTKQIRGSLEITSHEGTEAVIRFKPAGKEYGK